MSRIVQCILVFVAVLLMIFSESLHDYIFAFFLMFFTIFLRLVGIQATLDWNKEAWQKWMERE